MINRDYLNTPKSQRASKITAMLITTLMTALIIILRFCPDVLISCLKSLRDYTLSYFTNS